MENWKERLRLYAVSVASELEPLEFQLDELLATELSRGLPTEKQLNILSFFSKIVMRQKGDANQIYSEFEKEVSTEDKHGINQALMSERNRFRKIRHVLAQKARLVTTELRTIEGVIPTEIADVFSRFYQAKAHLELTDIIAMYEQGLTVDFRERYIKIFGAERFAEQTKQMKEWLGITSKNDGEDD